MALIQVCNELNHVINLPDSLKSRKMCALQVWLIPLFYYIPYMNTD